MEISEGMVGDRWSGWISTVENEMLELIHPHGSTVVEVCCIFRTLSPSSQHLQTCSIHPNSVIMITEPDSMCTAPATTSLNLEATPSVLWKETKVLVTRKSYLWGRKMGYLIDVSMIVYSNTGHRVFQLGLLPSSF